MRILAFAAAIFALTTLRAYSMTDAEIYNTANRLYLAGDYEGALGLYNSLNIANAYLEYNKGAAYLKTGKLGRAAVRFHRALRLDPDDEDAIANLEYINTIKPDSEKGARPGTLARALNALKGAVGVNTSVWVFTALYYAAAGLAGLGALCSGRLKKRAYLIAAVAGLAAMAWGGWTFWRIAGVDQAGAAVAVEASVDAFAEPSEKSGRLFTFHDGAACRISRIEGDFAQVTLASGLTGWVQRGSVEEI
ncbi:MAG: hypothetical protein HZB29_04660 [Nitrospinae bacterium]|nr:hypothetical protein [Nitrospinota bacterium]